MPSEEKSNKIFSTTIIVLTFIFITLAIGSQTKDVYDNSKLMPSEGFMINYLNLFIIFPICFFLFIKQIRKLKNQNTKALLFFLQAASIGLYGYIFIDNSHPIENNKLSEFSNYYTSNTKMFVPIIIAIHIFIGVIYLWTNRKHIRNIN